jgi:hypothetical protein
MEPCTGDVREDGIGRQYQLPGSQVAQMLLRGAQRQLAQLQPVTDAPEAR